MTRVVSVLLLSLFVFSGVFAQTPPTPTELRVTGMNVTSTGAYLTWRAPQGNRQYRIYRSTSDTLHFAAIGTSNTLSYNDMSIVRGTRYYYYVTAFVGTSESGRSNVASILLELPPPLPTPTNLTAVNAPDGHQPAVKLNWNGGRGPWVYKIFRSTNNQLNFHLRGATSDTLFSDRDVRADSTYNYYVRAGYNNSNDTTLSPPSNTASILVSVPPRVQGTVSGTVIDDSTSAPIRHVRMSFYRSGQNSIGSGGPLCDAPVYTDSLGRYTALLDTGRYILRANPALEPNVAPRYKAEYYNNCYEPSCATVIVVAANQAFTANMGLARLTPPSYNYVDGVVKDSANNPLRNANVAIIRTMQEMNFLSSLGFTPGTGSEAVNLDGVGHARGVIWSGRTDSLGRYHARVLSNNSYVALASKGGYLPQYWNNKPTIELADIIQVGNRDTSGINFALAVRPIPNNSISGVVKDSLGVLVPSRIMVFRTGGNVHSTRYFHTDSLGAYTVAGLEAGKYFVLASPFSGYGHAFYKAGAYGVIRIQDADTVNVTGNITGINIGVRPVTSTGLTLIRGTIRSTNNTAIAGVRVTAIDINGNPVGVGITDGQGAYDINAVAPGYVTVVGDRNGFSAAQTNAVVNANVYTLNNINMTMTPDGPTSVDDNSVVPVAFALNQNYPNPFNPSTTISFELPQASRVSLRVFNILGQETASLVNGDIAAGRHEIVWNGKDNAGNVSATGIYFYKFSATSSGRGEFTAIRKMLLVK